MSTKQLLLEVLRKVIVAILRMSSYFYKIQFSVVDVFRLQTSITCQTQNKTTWFWWHKFYLIKYWLQACHASPNIQCKIRLTYLPTSNLLYSQSVEIMTIIALLYLRLSAEYSIYSSWSRTNYNKNLHSQQEVIIINKIISFVALPEHNNYNFLLNWLNIIYIQPIKEKKCIWEDRKEHKIFIVFLKVICF